MYSFPLEPVMQVACAHDGVFSRQFLLYDLQMSRSVTDAHRATVPTPFDSANFNLEEQVDTASRPKRQHPSSSDEATSSEEEE
jgi:hypothetical protein